MEWEMIKGNVVITFERNTEAQHILSEIRFHYKNKFIYLLCNTGFE